ncbi:MAG: hypothetical protein IT449_05385 [Phycisphaerales bacterium]|nr:hypothetical protein [Phycisphaerales bacterium]
MQTNRNPSLTPWVANTEAPRHEPRRYQRLATVVVQRPRCPACDGVRLMKYRSIADQGDGSALAWVRCMADGCGCRFKLLME